MIGWRRGFTLLELMVALAIVAVVAAYAAPVYREQARRGYRVAAAIAVYRAAQHVERELAQRPAATDNHAATLPPGLDRAPSDGTPAYRLRVAAPSAANGGYAIIAEPLADGPMGHDPACGSFVLDATGRRANVVGSMSDSTASANDAGVEAIAQMATVSPDDAAATVTRCWMMK